MMMLESLILFCLINFIQVVRLKSEWHLYLHLEIRDRYKTDSEGRYKEMVKSWRRCTYSTLLT
jgi:hypothetical protein